MIKNHKWKLIISSVVILLPIVFGVIMWNKLPETMVSHWGADGTADGTASKAFMVFGLPLILLAIQWLLLFLEFFINKNNKPQNNKIVGIVYTIIPITSVVVNASIYSIALGKEWNLFALIPVFIGGMFMLFGNYLPKTTRNRTMGIKLRWTLGNDENWNKTHRLGGRLWFWCGMVIVISALLPIKIAIAIMLVVTAICVLIPTVYSYRIYKKHRAEGIEYEPVFDKKSDKVAIRITMVFVPVVLVAVAILMFTGSIEITYGETDFQIVASYMDDLTVSYDKVDSIEYRESFDVGFREMGYASAKLSMGTFRNDEFGRYTIYAYTKGEGAVVLKQGDRVLVLVGKTAEETKAVYDTLAEKIK